MVVWKGITKAVSMDLNLVYCKGILSDYYSVVKRVPQTVEQWVESMDTMPVASKVETRVD